MSGLFHTRGRIRPSWQLLGAAFVAQGGFSLLDQGLPTLTGFVKADLEMSASAAGLLVSSFTIGKCLSSYGAGAAADRFGERPLLILGGLGMGAAVSLAAVGPLPMVYAFLVLGGIAASVATPGGGRLVMVSFPARRRALALGIRQAAVPVGGAIGALLLPAVAVAAGWRWALVVAGAAAALGIVPLLLLHRFRLGASERQPAAKGSALNLNICLLTIWGAVFVSGQFALLAFLALDLQQRRGLALATGSILAALTQAGGLVGRIGWGLLADRLFHHGRKPLLLALTAVAFVSILLLALLPSGAPVIALIPVVALAGVGVVGFQGMWITLILESAPAARLGAATGAASTGLLLVVSVSTPLYGLVADLSGSYRAIWLTLAGALLCSVVPAMLVRETGASLPPHVVD